VNGTNQITTRVFFPSYRWRNNCAAGENVTVFSTNALSTRVLLLLRCGETVAALTNRTPNQGMMMSRGGFGGGKGPVHSNDPYLEFASDWAWAMFDRTICAHMRGDESLALTTARLLAGVQPKIEVECARRGFPRQQYYDYQRRGQERPYLDFLDQLPQILANLERRANEPKKISVIQLGITNYPDQTKRIAALIDDLDLVEARQWSQPGGVNLPEDPIVTALIQEGDPAVEPLLDCVDNDKRLTRSVGFGRDFFRSRTVIPVHDAARVALLSILQAGFGDGTAEIRAYWNKYKGMKLEDRWYAILKDNDAHGRWLEAAANITQPENVRRYPGGFSMEKPAPTNAPARMNGEILRSKSNPSVSELMARRALEVPKDNPNAYDLSAACQMELDLVVWDPSSALPVARILSKRACTVMQYSGQQLGTFVTRLALARAKAGDPQPFDDYASWIIATTPEQLGNSIPDCLEPFNRFPNLQALQTAAEKMFADTNSAWSRLPWNRMQLDNPVQSDLIQLPAFRGLLVREMGRTNICGLLTWHGPNMVEFQITNYPGYIGPSESNQTVRTEWRSAHFGFADSLDLRGSRTMVFPENKQPSDGTTAQLRWCDWIAISLSNGKAIPFFNPFAPIEERHEAIEKAKILLGQR
jgi:hypothetical protein